MKELKQVGIRKKGLQMAVKAINDTAGPNGLVPTLLVFGAYSKMNELNSLAPLITQKVNAIKKAIKKVVRIKVKRQINDALNIRNGPIIEAVHDFSLNFDVMIWRKNKE